MSWYNKCQLLKKIRFDIFFLIRTGKNDSVRVILNLRSLLFSNRYSHTVISQPTQSSTILPIRKNTVSIAGGFVSAPFPNEGLGSEQPTIKVFSEACIPNDNHVNCCYRILYILKSTVKISSRVHMILAISLS